jgi:hypothetical protein
MNNAVLNYGGSKLNCTSISFGHGRLKYAGSLLISTSSGYGSVRLNYGGSVINCTSVGTGEGVMNYSGSQMKGFQSAFPKIVQYMSVFIYNNGVLYDPFSVTYNIFSPWGHELKNQTEQTASRYSVGNYYANFAWWNCTTTAGANKCPIGEYTIVWEISLSQFGPTLSSANTFAVYKSKSASCVASDIASTGGSNAIAGAAKQSGTCNTLGYGIGTIDFSLQQALSGCGCGS